jgi:hypothetical protein
MPSSAVKLPKRFTMFFTSIVTFALWSLSA